LKEIIIKGGLNFQCSIFNIQCPGKVEGLLKIVEGDIIKEGAIFLYISFFYF